MISWYNESTSIVGLDIPSPHLLPEVLLRTYQRSNQRIYVRRRRVQVERRPRGGLHAEPLVCGFRAVVPRSHSDPPRVEQLGDVVRVHTVESEADGSTAHLSVLRADDGEAVDLLQTPERVRGDVALVSGDVVHADGAEVVGGGAESDGLGNRRGSGLEPRRAAVRRWSAPS